jgi:hypothetical protein
MLLGRQAIPAQLLQLLRNRISLISVLLDGSMLFLQLQGAEKSNVESEIDAEVPSRVAGM